MANIYDSILNGTFASLGPTIQPGMMGRGFPTDRLPPGMAGLPNPSPGSGFTPEQWAAINSMPLQAKSGELPSPTYAYAPSEPANPALTAVDSAVPANMTQVTGQMLPRQQNGGLLEMIFGPSKNGMRGLPGMMGGPNQGGLLQMLFGQNNTKGLPRVPGVTPAQAYAAKNAASRDMARKSAGKDPLYQSSAPTSARSDYGTPGAASDNKFFATGF